METPETKKKLRETMSTRTEVEFDKLRTLVWDMLNTMPPSIRAFEFAIRAGELGVTDTEGNPLVPACIHDGATK